jgi:hypothetical protein
MILAALRPYFEVGWGAFVPNEGQKGSLRERRGSRSPLHLVLKVALVAAYLCKHAAQET